MTVTAIALGANISTALSGASNTTFQLASGVYHQPMPQTMGTGGNSLCGYPDGSTVISGALLLNGTWTNTSGSIWKCTTGSGDLTGGQISFGAQVFDSNASGSSGGAYYPLCLYCNELFVNNAIQTFIGQGTTGAPLTPTTGQWWFNTTDNSVNFNATGLGTFPGTNVVEYSYWNNTNSGNFFTSGPLNFTFFNFTIEKFATQAQQSPISVNGTGANFIQMIMQWNHGVGISLSGSGLLPGGTTPDFLIKKCRILNNGQEGINTNQAHGMEIYDCEIAYNNRAGYNPGWDAGGFKHVFSHAGVIKRCHVHNNYGMGMWWDIGCSGWEIAENYVHDNAPLPNFSGAGLYLAGMQYEIGYGGSAATTIHDNIFISGIGSIGPCISIPCSDNMEVYQNVCIIGSGNTQQGGIVVSVNDGRQMVFSPVGYTFATVNIYAAHFNVHDNITIHINDTAYDGININTACPVAFSWAWDRNTYITSDTTTAHWQLPTTNTTGSSPITWATVQSQGGFGFDHNGQQLVGTAYANYGAVMNALRDGQSAGSITPGVVRQSLLAYIQQLANSPANNSTGGNIVIP